MVGAFIRFLAHLMLKDTVPRSNTIMERVETIVLSLNGWEQGLNAGAIAAFLDSLPSPLLRRVTFIFRQSHRIFRTGFEWEPVVAALQRLHQELSPDVRKTISVLILGRPSNTMAVSRTKDLLHGLRHMADVEVRYVPFSDLRYCDKLIPHFPLVTCPPRSRHGFY
jgi:hypothetical protein